MTVKRQAHKNVFQASWLFGHPVVRAGGSGTASWDEPSTAAIAQKGGGWVATLIGGAQSGDDWAACYIPVNEYPITMLSAAQWSYYMAATQNMGVNIVIWVHDPEDFEKRAEITQLANVTGLGKTIGWNTHELNTTTDQFFYYGENTTGTNLTAGSSNLYGLDDFQADRIFKDWVIYRISHEIGWDASGTYTAAYLAEVTLNKIPVPLVPPESMPYEFTINGVNFNGSNRIKTLMLPGDCASGAFVTLHHWNTAGSEENYEVPTGKVFIAYQALVYESNAAGIGVVGETDVADTTPFTKEVLFLSNGTALPSMENCWGTFAAGNFVTASSISYTFKSGSALYGVEIDA